MNDVIVGVDRSTTAYTAAEAAARLARERDSNLHLVMCVERSSVDIDVGGERFFSDSVSVASDYLRDLEMTLPNTKITSCVGVGSPSDMLCTEAERLEASAIVVGNRRVQGLARVLGSVASDVLRSAPCDVLIANTAAASCE